MSVATTNRRENNVHVMSGVDTTPSEYEGRDAQETLTLEEKRLAGNIAKRSELTPEEKAAQEERERQKREEEERKKAAAEKLAVR